MLVDLVREFNSDIIVSPCFFGDFRDRLFRNKVARRVYYNYLSDKEFESKKYKYLRCGQIVGHFIRDIGGKGIVLYAKKGHHSYKGDSGISFIDHPTLQSSHAIVEWIDGRIIDPMVGIVFPVGIEELLQLKGIDEAWEEQNDYFGEDYPHRNIKTHKVYAQKKFYRSVKRWKYYPFESEIK